MIKMHQSTPAHHGFVLPTILVLSLAILIMLGGILVFVSNNFRALPREHYQTLAEEAAEAGASYASACLARSDHLQTWGSNAGNKPDLRPDRNCLGATAYASNVYVYSDSQVRAYFNVGNLDHTLTNSVQIASTGYAEVLSPTGTVLKTYTSVIKKAITWPMAGVSTFSASGTYRTCAILSGSVYCWGYNAYGQLGNGVQIAQTTLDGATAGCPLLATPIVPPNGSDIECAYAGYDRNTPVKVKQDLGVLAGKTVTKVFTAQFHSCALTSDGVVYCWGYNSAGQLGDNTQTTSAVPLEVKGALSGKVVTDIGGTNNASCAIAQGKIYCWGNGSYGLVGNGTTTYAIKTPTLVSTGTGSALPASYNATALASSGSRSRTMCAIADGKAYCWGANNVGQVGINSITPANVLVPTKVYDTGVLSGKTVTSISQDGSYSGYFAHVCVVASGSVYCWGENDQGQLGENTTNDSLVPVAVDTSGVLSGKTINDVKVGLRHSCALSSGAVYCWGGRSFGQVGDGVISGTPVKTPVAVQTSSGMLSGTNAVAIGAGANRGCASVTDGRTFCWGKNSEGQIGDGTTIDRGSPTESLFLRTQGNQYIY